MSISDSRRVFAVGDIHGCATELNALIEKMGPVANDTVVFLGDYIDRGPDSKGVVEQIIQLSRHCRVIALKGNHEAMLLDFLDHPESAGAGFFILNGGIATLASYQAIDMAIDSANDKPLPAEAASSQTPTLGDLGIPDAHLEFFRTLRLSYETEKFFFVHAGVPDQPLATLDTEKNEAYLLWARHQFLASRYKWEKRVIHGHTPVNEVEMTETRINLDTGCVYGGKLTALEVMKGVFYEVEGERAPDSVLALIEQSRRKITQRFKGSFLIRAWRKGEAPRAYETLNYNQFGLLMRDPGEKDAAYLQAGDRIEGEIAGKTDGKTDEKKAKDLSQSVKFQGIVVRAEAKKGMAIYGVRIEKITGGTWGPNWVVRPK